MTWDPKRYPAGETETTWKQTLVNLRQEVNTSTLNHLERMLNASKGAGTTTLLIDAAKRKNVPLITHSASWADQLEASHGIKAKPFTAALGGEKVLIDNGVNWLLLREAQKYQRLLESLLNRIEKDKIGLGV